MNPLDWTAAPFLTFYVILAAAALLLVLALRQGLGPPARAGEADAAARLDPVELGYLVGGRRRAADTALVGFFEAGVIRPDQRGRKFAASPLAGAPPGLLPYYDHVAGCSQTSEFYGASRDCFDRVEQDLVAGGLLAAPDAIQRFWLGAVAILAVPLAAGVAKIIVGSERGHPVGILCGLVALTCVLGGIITLRRPYRTRRGARLLASARQLHSRAARAPLERELMLAFALSGAAVLGGLAYQGFFKTSSGDGSSGSDSGSGCGGGGCGGCGGCGS